MRDAPVSFREAAAGAPRRLRRVGMQATHRGSRPAAPCEIRQEHVLVMVGAPFGGHAWRLCQWHPTLRDVGRGSALGPSSNMSPFGRDSKLSFDGPRRQIPTHHESTRHNESKRACTRKKREAQPSRARLRGPVCPVPNRQNAQMLRAVLSYCQHVVRVYSYEVCSSPRNVSHMDGYHNVWQLVN